MNAGEARWGLSPHCSIGGIYFQQLTEAFVGGDRDGIGEVDAAGVLARHWDFEKRLLVSRIEVFWKSRGFIAEDQCVTFFEMTIVERFLSVC